MNLIEDSTVQSTTESGYSLKAADAVWIATALLHRHHPDRPAFSTDEIFDEVKGRRLTTNADVTLIQHIRQHCVANRDPNPSKLRMLFAVGRSDRRLYRTTDKCLPGRVGPTHPDWELLPAEYSHLRNWYEKEWEAMDDDPLVALIGYGKHLWKDEPGDQFLAKLRSNWGGID